MKIEFELPDNFIPTTKQAHFANIMMNLINGITLDWGRQSGKTTALKYLARQILIKAEID